MGVLESDDDLFLQFGVREAYDRAHGIYSLLMVWCLIIDHVRTERHTSGSRVLNDAASRLYVRDLEDNQLIFVFGYNKATEEKENDDFFSWSIICYSRLLVFYTI
jgi:hypothetical protein